MKYVATRRVDMLYVVDGDEERCPLGNSLQHAVEGFRDAESNRLPRGGVGSGQPGIFGP